MTNLIELQEQEQVITASLKNLLKKVANESI